VGFDFFCGALDQVLTLAALARLLNFTFGHGLSLQKATILVMKLAGGLAWDITAG
jgi:hypothetical protein